MGCLVSKFTFTSKQKQKQHSNFVAHNEKHPAKNSNDSVKKTNYHFFVRKLSGTQFIIYLCVQIELSILKNYLFFNF